MLLKQFRTRSLIIQRVIPASRANRKRHQLGVSASMDAPVEESMTHRLIDRYLP